MGVLQDPALEARLAGLHQSSDGQIAAMRAYYEARGARADRENEADRKQFLSDKLVALDRDKAEFCYQLCRASNACHIVEIGTSYGVSTLYLAAAVRDNLRGGAGSGRIIGTEHEPAKAAAARKTFAEAGLDGLIELREGDLRETLKSIDVTVDFLLVDIWIPMARPALELVFPHLRPGAIVICDNTERFRNEYADYFAFLDTPAHGFRTMTLPFDGGLELSVRG
ncbi:class I SAM-dependent methyltransferase [Bradyrhizobium genosp. L]|uniref:O-methyltransferase n=1 Tax=Bradyrhizobium genosp. L TaxID=83637 RepID=UPI0018A26059|nr:class I SAM-dependent methyltransferase [Bradyrhizobium genosp. L]QPF82749.1 class I SAM-dependent methyltransferase [Bradyrhizobium genosp. L]